MVKVCVTQKITPDKTTQTLIQVLAATNHSVTCWGFRVGGLGSDAVAKPAEVYFIEQTDIGGAVGTLDKAKVNPDAAETPQLIGYGDFESGKAEPGVVGKDPFYFHPVHELSGIVIWFPAGWEIPIPAGNRLGLVYAKGSDHAEIRAELYLSE